MSQVSIKKSDISALCETHSTAEIAEALTQSKGCPISENTVRKALKAFKLTAKSQRKKFEFIDDEEGVSISETVAEVVDQIDNTQPNNFINNINNTY